MNGFWHDTSLLLLTLGIDLAILCCWWLMGSHLYSADELPAVPLTPRPDTPLLHRVTTWGCGVLLGGLMIECTGLMIVIISRYGFSR